MRPPVSIGAAPYPGLWSGWRASSPEPACDRSRAGRALERELARFLRRQGARDDAHLVDLLGLKHRWARATLRNGTQRRCLLVAERARRLGHAAVELLQKALAGGVVLVEQRQRAVELAAVQVRVEIAETR